MKKRLRCLLFVATLVIAVAFMPLPEATATQSVGLETTSRLPVRQETYKIELNQNGLFRVGYADLQAAGMPVESVNPHTFEMMTNGQPVAYQFDGNANAVFEPHESILFYGWAFDGSRLEKQFISNNVFWLWADGSPTSVNSVANVVDGVSVESVSAEIYTEPENLFTTTNTHLWQDAPNEFDPWYWDKLTKTNADPSTHQFTVTLPHVAPRSEPAFLTVEVVSQNRHFHHTVEATLNTSLPISHTWELNRNVNITGTVPHNLLTSGSNDIALTMKTKGADKMLLNRISVEYQRALIADNDVLEFDYSKAGAHTFYIDQYSEGQASSVLAWNITDRHQPEAVAIGAADVVASGGSFRYRVGAQTTDDTSFFVTTATSTLVPVGITSYTPTNLEPANGAEWLAVTHELFSAETARLAQYRNDRSQLSTHIVEVEHVINQYGFGLPTPHGIQRFLKHAMQTWSIQPEYVVLVGDATMNPRQQACEPCSNWSTADPDLVPTFLEPVDRSLGMVPVDHYFSTLIGDDDVPDVSIGRLPVSSEAGMTALVNKIIRFEANLGSVDQRQKEMLFISDNVDSAGNFCNSSAEHSEHFSAEFNRTEVCLDDTPVDQLRDIMFDQINQGVLAVTYLGHGFIDGWASEGILRTSDTPLFTNADKPFVQISGNCLDGHFAWPGIRGISETLLELEDGGSAAHWGATGLGYLYEHQVLHDAMVEGLLEHGQTRIGDAIRYSKVNYLDTWYYAGQAYSSTLLGDPAMQLMQPDLVVEQRASESVVEVGETVMFEVQVTNQGNYPTNDVVIEGNISDGMDIIDTIVPLSVESSLTRNAATPNEITLRLSEALRPGQSVVVAIQAHITDDQLLGTYASSTISVTSSGSDANPENDSGTVRVAIGALWPTAIKLSNANANVGESNSLLLMGLTGLLTLLTMPLLLRRKEQTRTFAHKR